LPIVGARFLFASHHEQALPNGRARGLRLDQALNTNGRARSPPETAKNGACAATTSGFLLHLHPSG
jgi:hypothetical protein